MEDAIALVAAIDRYYDKLTDALAAYEAGRRPILHKLIAAANASAAWYERFAEHMRLSPLNFAMSYATRSGRLDYAKLATQSPEFVRHYEASCSPLPKMLRS